jgi:hypothetical protein
VRHAQVTKGPLVVVAVLLTSFGHLAFWPHATLAPVWDVMLLTFLFLSAWLSTKARSWIAQQVGG